MRPFIEHGAFLSEDRRYRYLLWRSLVTAVPPEPRVALWVMLNPSTANEREDDATIRRVIGFSRTWGFHRVEVVNLFALRATEPKELLEARDPVGARNNDYIRSQLAKADLVVGAWGAFKGARRRAREFMELTRGMTMCLGTNQDGSPKHPLYVKADAPLVVLRYDALPRAATNGRTPTGKLCP